MGNHRYTTVPNPPEHLSEEARQTWYEAGIKLVKEKRLTDETIDRLTNLCYWEEQKLATMENLRAVQSGSGTAPGRKRRSIILKNLKAIKQEVDQIRSDLKIDQKDSAWISETQPISDEAYACIPTPLLGCCDCLSDSLKKDLFLLTFLPVITAFVPNILAEHSDGYYSLSMSLFLIDNSGNADSFAKKITGIFDSAPGNKSNLSSAIFRSLSDAVQNQKENGDRFWGQSHALIELNPERPGNQNSSEETYGVLPNQLFRRVFRVYTNLKEPVFSHSNCLAGDMDQYRAFCTRFESNIQSSVMVYCGKSELTWQSNRPDSSTRALNHQLDLFKLLLTHLNTALAARNEPLIVELTHNQWQMIDDTFEEKMEIIEELALPSELKAANKKAAVYSLKLSALFSVIRLFDEHPDIIREREYITADDNDVVAALWIADTCLKHAIRAFEELPLKGKTDARGERYYKYYNILPPEFETAEAVELARKMNIADRTAKRYLNTLIDEKKLVRVRRGQYEKVG